MAGKDELASIVGIENILDDSDVLKEYPHGGSLANGIPPLYIVRPATLEEIQRLVQWANESQTPLVPKSSGSPGVHGNSLPSVEGSVIVDTTRMKKIVRVDRKNRVALFEPGVTYEELIPELAKEDLAPIAPLTPRKDKSAAASLLEREPVTMPRFHWEPQDPLRCLEVVFGSGDLFRTGSAAGPGTLEEQWELGKAQTRPYGPSFTDFAKLIQGSQGTLGIVTWVSVACRPLPKIKNTYFVPCDDLNKLADLTYKLLWKKLGHDCFIMNNRQLAALLGGDIPSLGKALPAWTLVFSIEGFGLLPEKRVAFQEADLISTTKSFGLEAKTDLEGIKAEDVAGIISQPSREPFWKFEEKGGCRDIFFLTTLDRTPEFVSSFMDSASKENCPAENIGIYLQPTAQGVSCHTEFSLYYNPEDKEEKEAIKNIDKTASRSLAEQGAFFSRPYGPWADFAYGNNTTTIDLQKKIKNMFDPKGIMNPGKLCF